MCISYDMLMRYCIYIKGLNKNIETIHSTTYSNKQCNCQDKEICSLQGNCLLKNIVYRATVKTNCSVKQYIDAMEGTIKQRIYNHKLCFTNRNYSTNTSLSTHMWHLKTWISHPLHLGNTETNTCQQQDIKKYLLCLLKKLTIITHPLQNTLLNKKSEILSKCRHENKHLPSHFDPYIWPILFTYTTSTTKNSPYK